MKKFSSLLLLVFLLTPYLKSQNVDSIKVEQTGDYIKIRYKILNSTPDQLYKVKVLCSIDGSMNTEIRSISGDVGDMIAGGKSDYWVVWDVLKDVDEIKSVEFIVRAELVKDNLTQHSTRRTLGGKILILPSLEISLDKDLKYGLRIGYLGSWGLSAKYVTGKLVENVYTASLDLTKRIVNKNKFKMHLFSGLAIYKVELYAGMGNYYGTVKGIEGGFICNINKIAFSYEFCHFKRDRGSGIEVSSRNDFVTLGIGMIF